MVERGDMVVDGTMVASSRDTIILETLSTCSLRVRVDFSGGLIPYTFTQEGTTGVIMRNCVLDHVSCDALELHFAQLLLSIEITNHNPLGEIDPSACHVDYMQYNGIDYIHQNVILRDIYATTLANNKRSRLSG